MTKIRLSEKDGITKRQKERKKEEKKRERERGSKGDGEKKKLKH